MARVGGAGRDPERPGGGRRSCTLARPGTGAPSRSRPRPSACAPPRPTTSSSSTPARRLTRASSARWTATPCRRCSHEEAIYIHQGQHSRWRRWIGRRRRRTSRRDVDYYTDANLAVRLEVLDVTVPGRRARLGRGGADLLPTIFKKIKLHTHENVGWGEITSPRRRCTRPPTGSPCRRRRTAKPRRPGGRAGRAGDGAGEHRAALPDVRPARPGPPAGGPLALYQAADRLPLRPHPRRRRLRRAPLHVHRRARARLPPPPPIVPLRPRLPLLCRPHPRGRPPAPAVVEELFAGMS